MIPIPAGRFCMGSNYPHGYDNEKQVHVVEVGEFELDRTCVTVGNWMDFIAEGCYRNAKLWNEKGYNEWVLPGCIEKPEYWARLDETGQEFGYFGPIGLRTLDPNEPVCGLSWYEADAYARWVNKRLPTEIEWEYAARFDPNTGQSRLYPWGDSMPDPSHASFNLNAWQPDVVGSHPVGASSFGIKDMAGGVWEWTSSPFLSYPGFEPYPYDGYSKEHMDGNHFVCRGGSWATDGKILRSSFRNWYVPTYRQGFLGLRCAR